MKLTDRVLRKKAKPVTFAYPVRNENLSKAMLALMYQERGIGLAATQVGLSQRLFVMGIDGQERACFNPEITQLGSTIVEFNEGCLSFKGDQCIINRPDEISVRYQNHRGDWYTERLSGLWARCFQHELDHLDGITMWDRYREQNAEQS